MSDLPVGRLLCVGIRGTRPGEADLERDLEACRQAGVGGVILFDVDVPALERLRAEGLDDEHAAARATRNIDGPDQLRELVAYIRDRLGEDVFVSLDQEGGRVARLSPRRGFPADPSAVEFAALDRPGRIETADAQAERLRELGFDLNFAPCVDLALDPHNEIIVGNARSYGRDSEAVVEAVTVVLDAHARAGVAACLKHFPGHGSSRGDTHRGAVDITESWRRKEELAPYRALCHRPGVAVMAAHVLHRGLDAGQPASLSAAVVGGLLRGELGFDGVVVTDSIDMRALSDRMSSAEAAVLAVDAGVDWVVDGFNLLARDEHPAPMLVDALRSAVRDGRIRGGAGRIERSLERLRRLRVEIGRPA